ncbi:SET domain-containing protein SmydA-8-like [Chrysoperla carnea]|uniref:SET domain-containing protein SmydA-8-like n=1 Tax=Chrysoperla carnea TaxID=189513 RepID=UPI001D0795A5|nr:SET domain-containing protein SmydA-8-like [Chrysoperla carnea]
MSDEKSSECSVCKQPAVLKCSLCKDIAYCCKDHQKKDWKSHKNLCRPFEIKTDSKVGRYLVATREIPIEQTIIQECPIIVGPKTHTEFEPHFIPCVGCYKPLPVENPPSRCTQCGWPACATHCPGLFNTKEHATECAILKLRKSFAVNKLDDFYRSYALTPLRCLLLQKRDPKKWKQLIEMESHIDKRGPDTEIYQIIEENLVEYLYKNYITPLKEFEDESNIKILEDCSRKTIHKLCGVIDTNSLDIRLPNGVDIIGIYPTQFLMEHSCMPNVKHIFEQSDDPTKQYRLCVKAARNIQKGEHLLNMYTHALWGTQARLAHLKETKYFLCECARCKDPTEFGTFISALKCMGTETKPCTDGYQLPINPLDLQSEWMCNKCQFKIEGETAEFLTNQLGEEIEMLQAKGPSVKELEQLLQKFAHFLHPNHFHIYAAKHSLIQLYGYQQGYLPKQLSVDQLKRKMGMCRQLIDITEKIDPHFCRLSLYQAITCHELFLAQFELIQRNWADQCFEKEREPYRDMLKECRVLIEKSKQVLGGELPGSPGFKLVNDVFKNSQKELERWIYDFKVNI